MREEFIMDSFERELEELFNGSIELPSGYQYMVRHALKNRKAETVNRKLLKMLAATCGCVVVMTSVVFAKDFARVIASFFTNSTEAINKAVENGYVQNVEDDFVYCNGVGIKVEDIIMNDSVLDISYLYSFNQEINSVELDQYKIEDDDNHLLYQYDSENPMIEKPFIVREVITSKEQYNSVKVAEGLFRNSVLYKSDHFPKSENLLITINRIKINNEKFIEGNWKLQVALDHKFNQREKNVYKIINTEHILKSEITLSETTLKVYLQVDEKHGDSKFLFENPANLKDADNQFVLLPTGTWNDTNNPNFENKSECYLEFELSKYSKNIERLYLKVPVNENLILNLELEED